MERHMALIKAILKYVEKHGAFEERYIDLPEFPDFSEEQVQYHALLCDQADFVQARRSMTGYQLLHLTWKGQEELARLRKECP